MRIIITGGTGLIGRALVSSLAQDSHEVIVLTRSPERRPQGLAEGAKLVGWDGESADGWGELADGADAIINLAGEGIADSRWSPERKARILNSRVNAGKAVMAAIQAAGAKPKALLQSSAVGYYGPSGDRILPETAGPATDFLSKVCFDWEASTAGAAKLGVRRAILRTGIVLSAQGGALPKMMLPFKLYIGGPLGSGKQYFPWIHIEDEVRAIRFLLENEQAEGPFNLAAPNPPTNAGFSKDLGKAISRPSLLPVPGIALKILFGEMSTVLLDGQRAVPQALEQQGFTFTHTDAAVAVSDLIRTKR